MRTKETPRRALKREKQPLKALFSRKYLHKLLRFAALSTLTAALSRGVLPLSCRPFGVGFAGALGGGPDGAAGLLGVLLGTFPLSTTPMRYVAAALMVFSANAACFDRKISHSPLFRPVVCAIATALTGFLYLSGGRWTRATLMGLGQETALTALTCLMTQELHSKNALLWLALGLTTAAGNVHPTAGAMLAALVTLFAARWGVGAGALTGGLTGLGAGLVTGGDPMLCAVLCLSGGAAGCFSNGSPLVRSLVFPITGASLGMLCGVENGWLVTLAAAFGDSVIPDRVLRRLRTWLREDSPPPSQNAAAEGVKYLLEEQSTAFRTLFRQIYDSVEQGEPTEPATVIIDRTAERLCKGCPNHKKCWKREQLVTHQTMNHALTRLLDRGTVTGEDFEVLRRQCPHFAELSSTFNEEASKYWSRRQYRSRMKNNRLAVCRQYAQLSGLLDSAARRLGEVTVMDGAAAHRCEAAAAELGCQAKCLVGRDSRGRHTLELRGEGLERLNTPKGAAAFSRALGVAMEPADVFGGQRQRLVYAQRPPLTVTTAVSTRQKREGEVSGDNGIWFRDRERVLWVILCDGMGSGAPAAGESRLLMNLLKDFLHAGIPPEDALTTLTGAMSLRGEIDGGFTTVDLLKIDLFTGKASLHKLGSAPTYLRKNGSVSRIMGHCLPVGLETDHETTPDSSYFTLKAGDVLLLVTDGITDGTSDDWLKTLLREHRGTSPYELAQSILSHPNAGREDDRTVVAVRVGNRA